MTINLNTVAVVLAVLATLALIGVMLVGAALDL